MVKELTRIKEEGIFIPLQLLIGLFKLLLGIIIIF